MKSFYVIAIVLVAALSLSPFVFLPKEDTSRFDGLVVGYSTYGAKIKSIDPATCGDTSSASLQGNFYEGLYAYHFLKRPVEVIPQLAAAMPEVSEDRLTYTIRLAEGVRYSRNPCFGVDEDGRPKTRTVRAEDFVLAFKRVADFHVSSTLAWPLVGDKIVGLHDYRARTRRYKPGDFSRYNLPIEGVTAMDERTVAIRLTVPFPQLVYVLASTMFAPVPPEVIDYHLAAEDDGAGGRVSIPITDRSPEIHNREAVVGTGPYVLTEWIRGGRIVLERNREFREQLYPQEGEPDDREAGLLDDAGKQVPFVDVLYRTYVAESNPAWMMFLTRQSDVAGIPQEVFDSVINPSRELAEQWERRGVRLLKEAADPSIFWFGFNLRDPLLGKSRSLRQALSLAYDVQGQIDLLMNGRGRPAVNMAPESFEGHKEAGPSPYARFDVEAARAKLIDARRELVEAGVLLVAQPIPPLTLDIGSTAPSARRMAEYAQGQFRQIGIELKVELNDWPTLQGKVDRGQVQLFSMGWRADYPDAETFLQLYYSPNIEKGSNSTYYSNPEFDELFTKAAVMPSSPERTDVYARMLKILNEDCPVLLMSQPVYFILVNDWVYNYKPHPIGYGFARFMRIDVEARRKAGGR